MLDTWQMVSEDGFMDGRLSKRHSIHVPVTTRHLSTIAPLLKGQGCPEMSLMCTCIYCLTKLSCKEV